MFFFKGFDCANHKILLATLYFYGIRVLYADWFWSYLTNRTRNLKQNHLMKLKILSQVGVNPRAFVDHNAYK